MDRQVRRLPPESDEKVETGSVLWLQREASLARQKEAAGAEPELAGFMNWTPEEAFAKASRTADKELFIVPGTTHIRTYFVKEYVDQISAKIQGSYTEKL